MHLSQSPEHWILLATKQLDNSKKVPVACRELCPADSPTTGICVIMSPCEHEALRTAAMRKLSSIKVKQDLRAWGRVNGPRWPCNPEAVLGWLALVCKAHPN